MRSRLAILTLAAVTLVALVLPLAAKSGTAASTKGWYEVVYRGSYEGTGHAHVVPFRVSYVGGKVKDTKTGATGTFLARKNLVLTDDGHFEGVGTVLGKPVKLIGRVEPPNGTLIKKARIIITFRTDTGEAGRAFGEK